MFLKAVLLIFVKATLQASSPAALTYEAGVVEFDVGSLVNKTSAMLLRERLTEYLDILENAPSTLDICVFPEGTLNTALTAPEIPEPEERITPCDDTSYDTENFLKQISCSAKRHKRYVVINVTEKSKCPDAEMIANKDPRECRPDGFSLYNTNVVFDRNGSIISRYRKFNLFRESVNKPLKPALVYFDTDFGVRFGHFICFDLIFKSPALALVRDFNVTDIVFTALWFSEPPFLTAVQLYQGWAHANNVNLLAAGANNAHAGSTGTGIFGGRKGAYVSHMAGAPTTKLHTASVYKSRDDSVRIRHDVERSSVQEMSGLATNRDQLDVYSVEFIDDSDGLHHQQRSICRGDVCCDISVNFTIAGSKTAQHYQYALAFYHGNRTYQGYAEGGVLACAVFACLERNVSTCGARDETLAHIPVWTSIEIRVDAPAKDGDLLLMPSSLDASITPLQPELFEYTEVLVEKKKRVTMKLNWHAGDLLTFGVYGFDYDLDFVSSGVQIRKISLALILISSVVVKALCNHQQQY